MLFWIGLIIFIITCPLFIYLKQARKFYLYNFYSDAQKKPLTYKIGKWVYNFGLEIIIGSITACCALFLVVSLLWFGIEAVYANKDMASLNEQYNSLVYQYENVDYDADIVGKKQLYDDIQNWNMMVAERQAYAQDFWIGIYNSDKYLDLKKIEYK